MASLPEAVSESRADCAARTSADNGVDVAQARRRELGEPKHGNWPVRLLPILFMLGLVAAVGTGLWNAANPHEGAAPLAIGEYRQTQVVTGPAAVSQMSRLHGKGVGVSDGYVGHYEGRGGGMVAYVAETPSEADADSLLRQMEERIGTGNQYFTGLKPVAVDGVRVLSVQSGQESHYFWAAGKKVVWIAFDRDDQPALVSAVRVIR